jgi:dynein heavy chain
MSDRAEHLHILRENVMIVVREYNLILDSLSSEERRLFAEHLRRVDRKVCVFLRFLELKA